MSISTSSLFYVFAFSALCLVVFGCHPTPRTPTTTATTTTIRTATTTTTTRPDGAAPPANNNTDGGETPQVSYKFSASVLPKLAWTTEKTAGNKKEDQQSDGDTVAAKNAVTAFFEKQISDTGIVLFKDTLKITVWEAIAVEAIDTDGKAPTNCDKDGVYYNTKNVITKECVAAASVASYTPADVAGTFKAEEIMDLMKVTAVLKTALQTEDVLPTDGTIKIEEDDA